LASESGLYERYREAVRGHALPLAFVDLDRLRLNASALVERAQGKPLRIATKSVRCVRLLRRVLQEFPAFRGLMCYTAAEAAWLADQGFDDLLVGYPTVEERDLTAAALRVARGRRIVLTVDDAEHVRCLDAVATGNKTVLSVCIDVDMSSSLPGLHFGVRRSPLVLPQSVVSLAETVRTRPSLRLDGILGYEAQIAGVPDAVSGHGLRNAVVRLLKRRSVREVAVRRASVVAALRDAGFDLGFVNGGGTGSLETTAADPSVTELTAGSGLFSPALFDGYAGFRHLPAAGFALAVTRFPAPGIYTCHGGGHVASGAAGPEKLPRPYLPEGAELLPLEGAGEVQTPVAYHGPVPLAVGEPIFFRHAKAGELCERFDRLLILEGLKVIDEAPSYRGEGKCFL
jgi:D-serine deaminase-like pyridoxal phosphate-dependent protein